MFVPVPRFVPARSPVGLDDLPEHRREQLLWRYALELDFDGVDDLVRELSPYTCRWEFGPASTGALTAVRGDDGRYHLAEDGAWQCSPRTKTGRNAGTYRHEQWCSWWSDGTRYRIQCPSDASNSRIDDGTVRGYRNRTVRWLVTPTDTVADPALVPRRHRCEQGFVRTLWPGYHGLDTDLGRLRATLVAALGPGCHACRIRPAAFVDHDHFTGLTRGLLCIFCNTHIDTCCHIGDCRWADYLNTPPAARLALRYPKTDAIRRKRTTGQKVALLGFDPLYRPGGRRSVLKPNRVVVQD